MFRSAIQALRSSSTLCRSAYRVQWARLYSIQVPPSGSPTEEQLKKQTREWANDMQRDWDAKVISYEKVKEKALKPSPDSFLVDVREPDEVIQGMIPSAVNIPLSVLAPSLLLKPEDFVQKFGFNKPGKAQEVIFYCRSGKRSTSASDVAKRNGYTNVLNYRGSWLEWVSQEKEGTRSE